MNKTLIEKAAALSATEAAEAIYSDPLTGLLNRRGFDELYTPGADVVLLDVDSLKYVNDHCGYRSGDRLLRIIADKLSATNARGSIARWGGDEFAAWGDFAHEAVRVAANDGRVSWGAANTLAPADRALKACRAVRRLNGASAHRGERPPWFEAWSGTRTK